MQKNILVVSPSLGFGELICQAVQESGNYEAELAIDLAKGEELLALFNADLLILDGDIGSESVQVLLDLHKAKYEEGHSLLIPTGNAKLDGQINNLDVDILLNYPFYLPDLIEALAKFFGPSVAVSESKLDDALKLPKFDLKPRLELTSPQWLEDSNLAARYLMQLSLETSAQGALISQANEVWAYSGEMSQESVAEIAEQIFLQIDYGGHTDLARFIQSEIDNKKYMLYSTALGGQFALALLFDAEIPFSKMREQAELMANSLAKEPLNVAIAAGESQVAGGLANNAQSSSSSNILAVEKLPESDQSYWKQEAESNNDSKRVIKELDGELVFSFALVPRIPDHQMSGDLRKQISLWLPLMCVAFGWRLEEFRVRRDYVFWVISVQSGERPDAIASTMAAELSSRIFEEIPRLAKDNPSGEFWAADPLIRSGRVSNNEIIDRFIRQTRSNQGLSS